MDGGLGRLLGPAFEGLIPTNPLPARSGGLLRDSPLVDYSGAVSVQLLPCRIFPWSSQAGVVLPSAAREGLGSCRSPNTNPRPTWIRFSGSMAHHYSTSRCSRPRSGSKESQRGLETLPGRQRPLVDLVPVSSLQVHGHGNSQGVCLGASHAPSVHARSLFQGVSPFNPTWKGKLGTSQPAQSSWFFWLKINLAKD